MEEKKTPLWKKILNIAKSIVIGATIVILLVGVIGLQGQVTDLKERLASQEAASSEHRRATAPVVQTYYFWKARVKAVEDQVNDPQAEIDELSAQVQFLSNDWRAYQLGVGMSMRQDIRKNRDEIRKIKHAIGN